MVRTKLNLDLAQMDHTKDKKSIKDPPVWSAINTTINNNNILRIWYLNPPQKFTTVPDTQNAIRHFLIRQACKIIYACILVKDHFNAEYAKGGLLRMEIGFTMRGIVMWRKRIELWIVWVSIYEEEMS